MNTAKKLEIEKLPQNYSPATLPEILKLVKKVTGDTAFIYERLSKPFFMETDRLIIRRFTTEDAEAVLALSLDRMHSSMKNFDHPWPADLEGCKDAATYFADHDTSYAVCLKPSMKLIGYISYNSVTNDGILDLGHVWHTAYQNNSLDTEALSLMTQYAFEKPGINGVSAGNPLDCEEQIDPLKSIGMEIIETREKASFVNDENGNPIEFTGCKMLITREQWEAGNPESYSPKNKPEILNLAEELADVIKMNTVYPVKTANGGSYIDGVPTLKWGEWKDCTYSGAAALLLHVMGINASYEQVAGLTGSCYRLSMCYGWDPGSLILNVNYAYLDFGNACGTDDNANRTFGLDFYTVEDETERSEKVQKSIDSGIPVLIMGGWGAPEWCLLTGYEKTQSGIEFFGRTYFDSDSVEKQKRTDNQYTLFNRFSGEAPGLFTKLCDRICEPLTAKDALKVSLETCLQMFSPHEKMGYMAYKFMIKSLKKNEYGNHKNNKEFNAWNVCMHFQILLDARRAAYIYLEESAELLSGENKKRLMHVSAMFREMFDTLSHVLPYDKLNKHEFDSGFSDELRNDIVNALQKMASLEKQARVVVRKICKHWKTSG